MYSEIWFSPLNVIHHYGRLQTVLSSAKKRSKAFRKATEAYHVAIMLVGTIDYQGIEYWMQLVDDRESSPDIRTARYAKRDNRENWLDTQDVEVVEYERHSDISIPEFLVEKKLETSKGYDDLTTILCRVNKTTALPPYKQIYSALMNVPSRSPVIILGKIHPTEEKYRICQVHPSLDLLHDFDVTHLLQSKQYRGVLKVRRSGKKKLGFVYNPKEKHFPFEKLEF
jgi:hypothetical protein